MTIRYDEYGNAYDDGEYDYSQEASQEVIVEDVPQEVIVEDVPQTFDTNSFYDDRGIGGNPTVDNLSGNDLYSFDYSPDSTASTPVIDDPYKYEPIDSGAYNYTPDVIEDPYTPSSGTSTVSTSQFENARATPLRPGGATPVRDFLFGRKGRYTESEPVVSSSPVAIVDSPISIQKADALAAADMSGYDYRPISQESPYRVDVQGPSPIVNQDQDPYRVDVQGPSLTSVVGNDIVQIPKSAPLDVTPRGKMIVPDLPPFPNPDFPPAFPKSEATPSAPMATTPSAPTVSNPLAPVNSVEAKAKAALGAAKDAPYQMTPREFEQKIHADLKFAYTNGTKDDQSKAQDAYIKAVANGTARPVDDPDTLKANAGIPIKELPNNIPAQPLSDDPIDLYGRYYETKDAGERKLIASKITKNLLKPLTENQQEAIQDGQNVVREVNYLPLRGPSGEQEIANIAINRIVQSHLQTLPGGKFITTPQDVMANAPANAPAAPQIKQDGAAPVGLNGQGIVPPKPAATKTTNSIIPVEDNKLLISFTGIDGQLTTNLINSPDGIRTIPEANQAVAKISARQAQDINNVPLPDIKKILRSFEGRQDALDNGTLDYLQSETNNWAESIKKESSNSKTNTANSNKSLAKGNSQSSGNTIKNPDGGVNSVGTDITSKTGLEQGGGNSEANQVGGSKGSTKGGDTTKVDNRANVMGMLNENQKIQVDNMMKKYANDVATVSRNHAAVLAPYLVRQAALGGKDSVSDFGSLAASLFRTPSVPQNFGEAVNPTTVANVTAYLQHVDTRQQSVAKAWSMAIPELYSATDGNSNPDNGSTPLSKVQFPWIKAIIDGKLGITESSKNAGIEATDFISKLNNFISPEDLSREKLRGDKAEEGIATSIANGNTHLLKSVQTYNTAKVLNALDVLTNIATMPAGTGKTPDGKDMPKQLIPFDQFVNTVATRMFNTPNGNSHLGPVAIEFIKSVPEYKRQLDELSKNKARGFLGWGTDSKMGPIYNKLQGFADWKNQDKWLANEIKGLPVRY